MQDLVANTCIMIITVSENVFHTPNKEHYMYENEVSLNEQTYISNTPSLLIRDYAQSALQAPLQ